MSNFCTTASFGIRGGEKCETTMSTTDDWLYSDDLDVGVSEVSDFPPGIV